MKRFLPDSIRHQPQASHKPATNADWRGLMHLHPRLNVLVSLFAGLVGLCAADLTWGDQVQMRNGDQYFGSVVSLNKDTLVIQSDVLGTIRLPRGKVAFVDFSAGPAAQNLSNTSKTNQAPHFPQLTSTNANAFSAASPDLGSNSNLLHQIEAQYLGDAGPEAKAKFNELLSGYLTGKLSVNDIRTEAQTAADQVRSLRKDMGDDAGSLIDGYLAILDTFLKESAPPKTALTNTLAAPRKPSSILPEEE